MSLNEQTFASPSSKIEDAKGTMDEELTMIKPSTKDTLNGDLHDAKGTVKEKAGQLVNDPDLEAEGQTEKIGGKIQKKVAKVEKALGH
jgi:uncharacterized protein YjbJ (UPF0337 family)